MSVNQVVADNQIDNQIDNDVDNQIDNDVDNEIDNEAVNNVVEQNVDKQIDNEAVNNVVEHNDEQIVEQNVVEQNVVEFVPLTDHADYEILTVHPFTIRRRDNHYEVRESIRSDGYVQVKLNNKKYYKHRLIAKQFISNPNDYDEIDHIK